jgi:UDP-glucose 4-epimerase
MNNLRILIIGSEGFIGSNILAFLETKYEVHSCDFIDIRGRLHYYQINPLNQIYLDIFNSNSYDIVINCAGSANVGASILNPSFDFDANVNVVAKLLSAILLTKRDTRLINISSAAVYGNPPSLPIKVDYAETALPISPYGVHKRMTEFLLREYCISFRIPTCSLRLFSAYGNGQRKLLLWDLFRKFSTGGQVELFGTGNESRDYIHIEDICQQVDLIIQNGEFKGESYNIANGEEVYIKNIADIFASYFGNYNIRFNDLERYGDPKNWRADIEIMTEWGYKQSISMEEGIFKYIKWAKENV